MSQPDKTWDYRASRVAWDYKADRSFFSGIIGPVGSGKSVASLQRIVDIGQAQAPSSDGIRRTRGAVIRNTMPELRMTTAQTYLNIYPEEQLGGIVWRSPATAHIRSQEMDIEVVFIALDKPQDVKKLLSLELTWAFQNEMREQPKSIATRLSERVGRYLLDDRPTTWSGLWGDSNPPDTDHYLYSWHHKDTPAGFSFHTQPPGVLEVRPISGGVEIIDENFPEWQGMRLSEATILAWHRRRVERVTCPVEVIESAERQWIVCPWAENMPALSRVNEAANPLGALSYYGRALAGKSLDEIRNYLQGVYTFVSTGRRVVPAYNGQVHGVDHIPVLDDEDVFIGADIGGGTLQPSAVFFQRHPRGVYLMHREVVCFDLGIETFGRLLKEAAVRYFPRHVERGMIGKGWGDPAGEKRDEIFETASFDYLRREHGVHLQPAPSQDPMMRVSALNGPCTRMIDGKPAILVNKRGCPTLHKGLMGAWHYRRIAVAGEERFADKPSKNDVSHVCDGAGYGLLGAGEFAMLSGASRKPAPLVVNSAFDPLA